MEIPIEYVLVAIVAAVLGFGGGGCLTRQPTKADQWETIYRACEHTHDGESLDNNRRSLCIQAADRVVKCSETAP